MPGSSADAAEAHARRVKVAEYDRFIEERLKARRQRRAAGSVMLTCDCCAQAQVDLARALEEHAAAEAAVQKYEELVTNLQARRLTHTRTPEGRRLTRDLLATFSGPRRRLKRKTAPKCAHSSTSVQKPSAPRACRTLAACLSTLGARWLCVPLINASSSHAPLAHAAIPPAGWVFTRS